VITVIIARVAFGILRHSAGLLADTAVVPLGRIRELALAVPGVLAVLTGADYAADGLGSIPCDMSRNRRDGSPMYERINRTLVELNQTLKSVDELARTLEDQPSSLIFSIPREPDPEPRGDE